MWKMSIPEKTTNFNGFLSGCGNFSSCLPRTVGRVWLPDGDQHHIIADAVHILPRDDQTAFFAPEALQKGGIRRHHQRGDAAVLQAEFQVHHLAQPPAVGQVDHFFLFQLGKGQGDQLLSSTGQHISRGSTPAYAPMGRKLPMKKSAPASCCKADFSDAAGTVVSRVLSLDDHLSTPHVAARLQRSL